MTRLALAFALALAAAGLPGRVLAQATPPSDAAGTQAAPAGPAARAVTDSALDARTREVASTLRCPVCQGQSIQDSDAPLAGEMRDLIREKLRGGESPDQVRGYFVSKYGQWILLRPQAQGFVLAVYLLPILGILAGGAVIVLAARRWVRAAPVEADGPTATVPSDRS